jgi:hypothetical protein
MILTNENDLPGVEIKENREPGMDLEKQDDG